MNKMTAKKIVEAKVAELGGTFQRSYTKTVSFSDLGRDSAKFIYFEGLSLPNPTMQWDLLKQCAKENGLILGSLGI